MGRTNQVLTGGSIFSTSPQTTTMKIVLALLVLCLVQFSLAEQEEIDNVETNLVLERDAREAGKKCDNGDRKCKRRQKKKKSRKNAKKGGKKKSGKGKKQRQRSGKKTGKQLSPKRNGKKVRKQNSLKRQGGARSSSKQRASGRQDTCFADLVAKTKKSNKAQVEFRLAKRVESWGKLMKNKKSNAASTFADALEAMNDATGNGTGCDGDSASLQKPRKSKQSWRTVPSVRATTAMRANWPPRSTRPLCLPAKTHLRPLPRTSRFALPSQVMQRSAPVYKA